MNRSARGSAKSGGGRRARVFCFPDFLSVNHGIALYTVLQGLGLGQYHPGQVSTTAGSSVFVLHTTQLFPAAVLSWPSEFIARRARQPFSLCSGAYSRAQRTPRPPYIRTFLKINERDSNSCAHRGQQLCAPSGKKNKQKKVEHVKHPPLCPLPPSPDAFLPPPRHP